MGRPKSEATVKITKHGDRPYAMYWTNPTTGKAEWRSTGKQKRDDALAVAAVWAADIREQRYSPDCNIAWDDFRTMFLDDHASDYTSKCRSTYVSAFNALERHVKVGRLAELSADRLKHTIREWEKEGLAPETIHSYVRHIRAALNWAKERELLRTVPKVSAPKRKKGSKRMKGRPITREEFERLVDKIAAGIVAANVKKKTKPERVEKLLAKAKEIAPEWQTFLEALWWSGLRLGEALTLSWTDEQFITVDMSGPHPRLRIEAGQDKSQAERLLPVAPEFAAMLAKVPKAQRKGTVFALPGLMGGTVRGLIYASKIISLIGKAAGVKVKTDHNGRVKFASAHDLRRSFGTRWATRVMPATLQRMMRHADISTTMSFYADIDAKSVEEAIYATVESESKVDSFVDNGQSSEPSDLS
jgi:integrase